MQRRVATSTTGTRRKRRTDTRRAVWFAGGLIVFFVIVSVFLVRSFERSGPAPIEIGPTGHISSTYLEHS
jgi:hypothetical protein